MGSIPAPSATRVDSPVLDACRKKPPTKAVTKRARSREVCTLPLKGRSSASHLVRQCDAALTGSQRGPHQKQTQVIHTALCSPSPPAPLFKHPRGPLRVWRAAPAPLQGGRVDWGTPATHTSKDREHPRECLYGIRKL